MRDESLDDDDLRVPSADTFKTEGDRRWIEPGHVVTIAGHEIPGGMLYVGQKLMSQDGETTENCLIDPALPVAAKRGDSAGQFMDYWPTYETMNPSSRLAYLRWLANGRSESDAYIGYVFLFFYGLERRLVLERSTSDHEQIIQEVLRLRALYGENRSFARYSSALLDAAAAIHGEAVASLPPEFDKRGYQTPLRVKVTIGRAAQRGDKVPSDWLLSWVMTHPETRLGIGSRRDFDAFRELFRNRYARAYPNGLDFDVSPQHSLRFSYKAASGSFEAPLDGLVSGIADIARARRALTAAQALAVECAEELDVYARFLGRRPDDSKSLEALAFLPREIRGSRLADLGEETLKWLHSALELGARLPLRGLFERLRGTAPEKITQRDVKQLADALGRFGLGLSPDPRFAFSKPGADDEVILFGLPSAQDELGAASAHYRGALLTLTLGMLVAQADGVVTEEELASLNGIVDESEGIDGGDRARLRANLQWMETAPLSLNKLRSRLKDAPPNSRERIGLLAVSVAAADGRIDPAEVRLLERLYGVLQLEPEKLYSDLNNLGAEPDATPPEASETTPSTFSPEKGFSLDPARIVDITKKTTEISEVLGDIFELEEEVPDSDPEPDALDGEYDGLDNRHGDLLTELLKAETWTRSDFERLARQFDLMPDGALEILNEWALEAFDETLIEEGEPLAVNREVLEMGAS